MGEIPTLFGLTKGRLHHSQTPGYEHGMLSMLVGGRVYKEPLVGPMWTLSARAQILTLIGSDARASSENRKAFESVLQYLDDCVAAHREGADHE